MDLAHDVTLAYEVNLTDDQKLHTRTLCEELDSGKHQQGCNALVTNGNLSFLGLASELSQLGKWSAAPIGRFGIQGYIVPNDITCWWSTCPDSVVEYYGFTYPTSWHFMVPIKNEETSEITNVEKHLAWFNDNGYTFSEISYLIRTKILGDTI